MSNDTYVTDFTVWLRTQAEVWGPVGDLAKDVERSLKDGDPWPKGSKELRDYVNFLENSGACEGAIKALKNAWRAWRIVVGLE